jgi:UDP-N-acetylmuramate dehydrogenase
MPGAYGRDVSDILIEATLVLRDGTVETWPAERFAFTYRHSDTPPGAIVVEALFEGAPGDPETIGAEMDRIAAEREASQPFAQPHGRFHLQEPARRQGLGADRRRGLAGASRSAMPKSLKSIATSCSIWAMLVPRRSRRWARKSGGAS